MMARLPHPLLPAALRAAALGALAALASACAPLQPELARVGRAQLQLPPGDWQALATQDAVFDARPDDVAHDLPMQSRLLALRSPGGELLATLLVQTNASNFPRDPVTLWQGACPRQTGVQVQDFARGGGVRVDCLRYRRRAQADDYLAMTRPALAQWLGEHQALPAQPYSHISYRYTTPEGGYVGVELVADQRLLRAPSGNTLEFLRANPPAQAWMEQLRDAVRASAAMLDGRLVLPPFPQTLPL